MRKTSRLLAALLLTISIYAVVTAQTSPLSSPTTASPAATEELTPDQVVRLLIDRLKEERQIHEATKRERDEAVASLEIEKKNSESLERSYKAAEDQIARLDRALQHQDNAIALFEKTIAMVEKQRDDAKKEAKRSRKIAIIASLVTIAKMAGVF